MIDVPLFLPRCSGQEQNLISYYLVIILFLYKSPSRFSLDHLPQLGMASNSVTVSYSRKDASHHAFYAGFFKGMGSAFEGLKLLIQSPRVRHEFSDLFRPMINAGAIYIATGVIIFGATHNMQAEGLPGLLATMSRWGRIIVVALNGLFDLTSKANSRLFFTTLREKNVPFSNTIEKTPTVRTSLHTRWAKFTRVVKLSTFKLTAMLVRWLIPNAKFVAIPAVKFVSMRPVLGNEVAAAVSLVDALPLHVLHSTIVDDILVSFGESIIDADDLGADITKPFARRLTEEKRAYFASRYRGYITGCAFVYSMLSAIPIVGIPVALAAECGAACMVADIVKRNLKKDGRMTFPGEEHFLKSKDS